MESYHVEFLIGIYIWKMVLLSKSYFLAIILSVLQLKEKLLFFHLQDLLLVKKLETSKKLKSELIKKVMKFGERNQ